MTLDRIPVLSYADIAHSMRFLSFFTMYVAPFYERSVEVFEREVLPTMLLSQGLIYQADAIIEAAHRGEGDYAGLEPWFERRRTLLDTLQALGLYVPMMEREADNVTAYWRLEDQMMVAGEITEAAIMGAIDLRVSDIMLLHAICHRMTERTHDAATWTAIRRFEELRDIDADIIEYAADVASGDFNIYRMMIALRGADAAGWLHAIREARKKAMAEAIAACDESQQARWRGLLKRYYAGRPERPVPAPIIEAKGT